MSLVRIAYIYKTKPTKSIIEGQQGGSNKKIPKYNIENTTNDYIDLFEASLDSLTSERNKKKKIHKNKNKNKNKTTHKKKIIKNKKLTKNNRNKNMNNNKHII